MRCDGEPEARNLSRREGRIAGMRARIVSTVGLTTVLVLLTAPPALAGAPNYTCRFGTLRVVADVHRYFGLLQEAPRGPLRQLQVPLYGSGGSGFTAVSGRDRFTVRLLGGGGGEMLRGTRSQLVRVTPSTRRVYRGICTELPGNQHAGRVTAANVTVRTARRPGAPAVTDTFALPFVWSLTDAVQRLPPAGWVAVRLWRADGRHTDGFLPKRDVRFS
jgi:hypothetical protein